MAAHRRPRSEARHGNFARRSPRHDGAWRQGTGSVGRLSGRYRDVAVGYAAAETDPPATGRCGAASADVVVWAGKKADDPPSVAAARAAMLDETEDEYRRLLYVAMTRAADRLIIGGCMPGNMNTVRKFSWYDLIVKGLDQFRIASAGIRDLRRHRETLFADRGCGRCRATQPFDADRVLFDHAAAVAAYLGAAGGACRSPAAPVRSRRGRRPSHPNRGVRRRCARARFCAAPWCTGCCNRCPISPPARRRDAALGYLARNAGDWTADDREALAAGVLALIEDPRFAAVFAAGSRAEVAIVGRLDRPGRPPALVSGQIDRLVVTPAEVLIVDYKTNHAPPGLPPRRLSAYVRQLALYRAVLRKLYPRLRSAPRCSGPKRLI